MAQASTQTRGGRIETRYDCPTHDEALFTYEEITELLIISGEKKLPLRKSLFPHVAPYVLFQLHNANGLSFPKEVSDHLTWELGSGTPWIVRKTVENSGYRLVLGTENWSGTWSESTRYSVCYDTLKNHQKINHFPGTYEIGRKDRLWKNMSRLMSAFGKRHFGFVPKTFILPQELDELRRAWEAGGTSNKWIIKPPASSRGRGVSVVNRWTQIPRKLSATVVQRYLSNPKLINGSKFDLRVYALVTGFNPLKIYVHSEGLVRFACARYNPEVNCLYNRFMHLTNYSVNKFCADYVKNDTLDGREGHKWTLKSLWDYLTEEGIDVAVLRRKIHDIIVKAMVSGEASVNRFSKSHHTASSRNCYELFGVDILIDDDLKPWLLEVNISPSLHAPSALDIGVKGRLVRDVLNLAGYRLPSTLPPEILREMAARYGVDSVCQDVRATDKELSVSERRKQMRFMYRRFKKDRGDCSVGSILDELTPDDVRKLVQYEDEISRLGEFLKVFPTADTRKYFRYFEWPRYYNMLLSAWEIRRKKDRKSGIDRLKYLCASGYHLR